MITERIKLSNGDVLRPLYEIDIPRVVEQCRDPESVRWTRVPTPYTEDDARAFIAGTVPGRENTQVFVVEHGGQFAGSVALRHFGNGAAEIQYGLHPDERGKGLMVPAVRAVIEYGFAEKELQVVRWTAAVGNHASRAVAERSGVRVEGVVRKYTEQRGELVDCWVGTICREDLDD